MYEAPPQDVPAAVSSDRLSAAAPTLATLPNVTLLGYPVSGRSRRAVREEINRRRPEVDGQRHDARTLWRFSTRWRSRSDGTCMPETTEVTVRITVTLPDLQDPSTLGRDDRAAWTRYMTGLEHHEANHARLANTGAQQMLQAMRAAPDCETLQAASRHVSEQVAAASREYDRQTRHGATEGAQF